MATTLDGGRHATAADYGEGEYSFEVSAELLLDEQALSARILAAFKRPGYSPPRLPSVGMQLMRLAGDRDADLRQVMALLQSEPMLAGEVLRVAQTAYYAGAQRLPTLRDALVRLGMRKLHDIVVQASMNMRVFRSPQYAPVMERLRRHSAATACITEAVSRYTPLSADGAYTAGLLHDVGLAGILLVLGDVPAGRKTPDLGLMWPAIHRAHAEAASIMARLWGLPEELALLLGAHHEVSIDGYVHPTAATVCIAEDLATELGLPATPDALADRSTPRVLDQARQALALDERKLALIREDAERLVKLGIA